MSEQFKKEFKDLLQKIYGKDGLLINSEMPTTSVIRNKDEALTELKNAKYKESVLERLSFGARLDKDFMLKAIEITPKAYDYAAIGIKNTSFTIDAIERSLGVGAFLSDKQLNDQRILDVIEQKILDAYKEAYTQTLNGSRHIHRDYVEQFKTPSESYIGNVESAMPCLAKKLQQVRQEVLRENAEFACNKVSIPTYGDYGYWMNEIRQNCPELEDKVWEYRSEHADEIEQYLSKDDLTSRNFSAWLQKELEDRGVPCVEIDGLVERGVEAKEQESEISFNAGPVIGE